MCPDYDGNMDTAQEFYKRTQVKLVFAIKSYTPEEVVAARADRSTPNISLVAWQGDNTRKSDVVISKNYLAETEIKELNRLTTILLDIFEDQLVLGVLSSCWKHKIYWTGSFSI